MSQGFFEIERGLLINGSTFLSGAGAPPGSGDSGVVGIGSQYLDTSSGDMYIKKIAGVGAGNWTRIALSTEMATGISWREPVRVVNEVATSLPTGTPTQAIVVDGLSIVNNDRVLFSGINPSSGRNVYIYDQALGTFTEDANQETEGDMVFCTAGTSAGRTYNFNGTSWVLSNQSNLDEEGFIRAFIGKSAAGNVLPTYSTTNYVANGDNIETAIGKLDARAKTNADNIGQEITDRSTAVGNVQTELNDTQTGAGLNANGTYTANGVANYISTATSLKAADNLLDGQLKTVSDDVSGLVSSMSTAQALLARARAETSSVAVTSVVTLDSVVVDSMEVAKWIVYCQGNGAGNAGNKSVVEILATHDGHAAADATDTDFNVYAKLRMGNINGLNFNVDVTGAGAAQVMRLRISSTMSVDVKAIREVIA